MYKRQVYYELLSARRGQLAAKRALDVAGSLVLLVLLSPVLAVIAIVIKCDSKGPVMFRQVRITQYGRAFRIYKFRTMVDHAESLGAQVTTKGDARITGVGRLLRKTRLDELPQLINILLGDMSFVGTRPEVEKYVAHYSGCLLYTSNKNHKRPAADQRQLRTHSLAHAPLHPVTGYRVADFFADGKAHPQLCGRARPDLNQGK